MDESESVPPSLSERLGAIIAAFYAGVPHEQALAYIEELRGYPSIVRVEPSDMPEAEYMLYFLELLEMHIGSDTSLVFTPEPEPTVEYLRQTNSGTWRRWYPGEPLE